MSFHIAFGGCDIVWLNWSDFYTEGGSRMFYQNICNQTVEVREKQFEFSPPWKT